MRFAVALALCFYSLAFAEPLRLRPQVPQLPQAVERLVQWEVGSNSSLSQADLERMATACIEGGLVPPDLLRELRRHTAFDGTNANRIRLLTAPRDLLAAISRQPIPLQYYEIPIAALQRYVVRSGGETIDYLRQNSTAGSHAQLVVEREGQSFVRWFIHPLDTPPHDSTAAHGIHGIVRELQRNGTPVMRGTQPFFGRLTSSRSLIVQAGEGGTPFSVKVSLRDANGNFRNKAVDFKSLRAWVLHDQYFSGAPGRILRAHSQSLDVLQEPLGFGVWLPNHSEDGFLVRSLAPLAEGRTHWLPAFAALHETTGREIARINGSQDPLAFWEQHLLRPLALGMADLRAYTGAEHTSPHSQNILIELNHEMRPTGRILLRDLDYYIDALHYDLFVPNPRPELVPTLTRPSPQKHMFSLQNGLAHMPSWIPSEAYHRWVDRYHQQFLTRLAQDMGVPGRALGTGPYSLDDYLLPRLTSEAGYIDGPINNFHVTLLTPLNNSTVLTDHLLRLLPQAVNASVPGHSNSPQPTALTPSHLGNSAPRVASPSTSSSQMSDHSLPPIEGPISERIPIGRRVQSNQGRSFIVGSCINSGPQIYVYEITAADTSERYIWTVTHAESPLKAVDPWADSFLQIGITPAQLNLVVASGPHYGLRRLSPGVPLATYLETWKSQHSIPPSDADKYEKLLDLLGRIDASHGRWTHLLENHLYWDASVTLAPAANPSGTAGAWIIARTLPEFSPAAPPYVVRLRRLIEGECASLAQQRVDLSSR